jgi:uncharacterized protein YdcH (DUF465 family)
MGTGVVETMIKSDRLERIGRIEALRNEHARLEMRLAELERHLSLSPDEQRERAEIKKAKLQLKDTLLHLQRDN